MKQSATFNNVFFLCRSLVLSLVFFLTACNHEQHDKLPAGPTIKVHAYRVEARIASAMEEVPGSVRPRIHATIEAKVSGRIDKLIANEGQQVKEGDLLCELDVRELRARLEQALATQEEFIRELKRYSVLVQQKAVTQAEFEATQAKVRVADAAVVETQAMLGYARVTAPFEGTVTRKLANAGDLAAPGRALFEMEDPRDLRLEAGVPEALIGAIKLGETFEVKISGLEKALMGTVGELSPTADPNSRTYLVKLDLPSNSALRSGQFGRVAIPAQEEVTLRVPRTALIRRGQIEIVYVANKGRAWMRLVRSGRVYGDTIELLAGISSGEEIVSQEIDSIIDGQLVEVIS